MILPLVPPSIEGPLSALLGSLDVKDYRAALDDLRRLKRAVQNERELQAEDSLQRRQKADMHRAIGLLELDGYVRDVNFAGSDDRYKVNNRYAESLTCPSCGRANVQQLTYRHAVHDRLRVFVYCQWCGQWMQV